MSSDNEIESLDPVASEKLVCLNAWPKGTIGFQNEQALIEHINTLCNRFGYGRVPQLAQQIEQIWRDEAKIAEFQAARIERLKQLKLPLD